jgi:septum formation protein
MVVMKIILGSTSPRRKEILSFFSIPFKQESSDCDESQIPFSKDPQKYACLVAEKKGEILSKKFPDAIILTADTVVFCKNTIYNKPESEKEAQQMLSNLSGSWHQVFTGVSIKKGALSFTQAEETKILFHPLTDKQIKAYHQHFYFFDKAGGYAIQEGGGIVVKRMEGCFYNAMGFPITTVRELLLKVGIDLWDYLK